jgi:RNA polymerase sigma factor (sigma-70 family)
MTDEMIMKAVKDGNLHQASLLFERYNKRIYNFLFRMTMDREMAGDLTQNVFLRMLKYRGSYNGDRFESWIYRIARNVFSDHYQSAKNKASSFVDVEKVRDHLEDNDEPANQQEREKILHLAMKKLNDDERELLVLTRFQQMKYEEVAHLLDMTVANIKVKVHRAIIKLRQLYFELEKSEI